MVVTFPNTIEEHYAKFTFTAVTGDDVYSEIPAVFIDGVLDEVATTDKINKHIEFYNRITGPKSGTQG